MHPECDAIMKGLALACSSSQAATARTVLDGLVRDGVLRQVRAHHVRLDFNLPANPSTACQELPRCFRGFKRWFTLAAFYAQLLKLAHNLRTAAEDTTQRWHQMLHSAYSRPRAPGKGLRHTPAAQHCSTQPGNQSHRQRLHSMPRKERLR